MLLCRRTSRRPTIGWDAMSTLRRRILVAATLACLLFAASSFATPAAAGRDLTYQLYGSRNGGWGSTNTSLTTPGPLIEVEVGDNVTLNLTSLDGLSHRWFIDYNNNSAADASEVCRPARCRKRCGALCGREPRDHRAQFAVGRAGDFFDQLDQHADGSHALLQARHDRVLVLVRKVRRGSDFHDQ